MRGGAAMGRVKLVGGQFHATENNDGNDDRFADVLKTVREERVRRERTRVRAFSLRRSKPAQ